MSYDNLQDLVDNYIIDFSISTYTESFEIVGDIADHLIEKFPLIYNQYEGRRDYSKYDLFCDEIEVEIEAESFSEYNEEFHCLVYLSDEIKETYILKYPEYLI